MIQLEGSLSLFLSKIELRPTAAGNTCNRSVDGRLSWTVKSQTTPAARTLLSSCCTCLMCEARWCCNRRVLANFSVAQSTM